MLSDSYVAAHCLQRGTKSHPKKYNLTYIANSQQKVPPKFSIPPKIKFPVHSHLEYMLQKVFKITAKKLTIGRV